LTIAGAGRSTAESWSLLEGSLRLDSKVILFLRAHPRQRRVQAPGKAGTPVMLLAFDIKLVVLAQERERLDLAGQLEPDSADLTRIVAAAVQERRVRPCA